MVPHQTLTASLCIWAAFRAAGLGEVEAREVVADIRFPSIVEFVPGHLTACWPPAQLPTGR
jgi:hypothetical protein